MFLAKVRKALRAWLMSDNQTAKPEAPGHKPFYLEGERLQNTRKPVSVSFDVKRPVFTPEVQAAMDDGLGPNNALPLKGAYSVNWTMNPLVSAWYQTQGFIGYQACGWLSQQWLIDKACSMPAEDAVRKGWEITINDGKDIDVKTISAIKELDKLFLVRQNLVDLVKFKRVFGVRVAYFVVDSPDPDYYRNPFNIDSVAPGAYRGISQVDPYWCIPELDLEASSDPSSENYLEPTWWRVGTKLIHRSHCVVVRHSEVSDFIKPTYIYGGVSVPQQVYERVYAAERCANESPALLLSKRMRVQKVNLEAGLGDSVIAACNDMCNFQANSIDNFGTLFINESDEYMQHETSLSEVEQTIMTQYQLVAAIAEIPATRFLGAPPKGFNATGENEQRNYHEMLSSLQAHDMGAMLERHYQLLAKSEFPDMGLVITPAWTPLDEPTSKEIAETNGIQADTYVKLASTGAVGAEDIREAIIADKDSGFTFLEDKPFELPEETELETEQVEREEQE